MFDPRTPNQRPLDAAMKCKIRGLHSEGRTVREISEKCGINMALTRIYMNRLKLKICEETQVKPKASERPVPESRIAEPKIQTKTFDDYRYDTPGQIVRVARNIVTIPRPVTHVSTGSVLVG